MAKKKEETKTTAKKTTKPRVSKQQKRINELEKQVDSLLSQNNELVKELMDIKKVLDKPLVKFVMKFVK